ncbi:hypothetical protein QVD17_29530 [Tagetes erecta]|uniref:Uncharacterized protein n=1 Tax=Tagetes erecta TaxID=13708 RepID=A0AAD8KEU5_TARER|nr:hypothetical protein QVD17_29530 [Tagetes erecta]
MQNRRLNVITIDSNVAAKEHVASEFRSTNELEQVNEPSYLWLFLTRMTRHFKVPRIGSSAPNNSLSCNEIIIFKNS